MLDLALGNSLMTTKGAADPEVERVYQDAVAIAQEVEDTPQSFMAIRGLSLHSKMRAEYEVSEVFERQLLEMAQNLQDPMLLTEAHRLNAESKVYKGDFSAGLKHYQQAAETYQPELHPNFIGMIGIDSGIIAQSQSAYFTWIVGFPERALNLAEDALNCARELNHPFSLAIALDTIAALYHQLRDPHTCLELTQECSDLAMEYHFPFWDARACIRRGWALAMMGETAKGIGLIDGGIEALSRLGSFISMPCMWALLAEAQLFGQDFEGCLTTTETAIATIERLNERYCEVEIYRIRAICLDQIRDRSGAEAAYERAIQVARSQAAKSLELRARLELAKHMTEHGDPSEQIQRLRETFDWFQEGFETVDLIQSRVFLQVNHSPPNA
jgi:tetratricopeptide (TPR) repeat protein